MSEKRDSQEKTDRSSSLEKGAVHDYVVQQTDDRYHFDAADLDRVQRRLKQRHVQMIAVSPFFRAHLTSPHMDVVRPRHALAPLPPLRRPLPRYKVVCSTELDRWYTWHWSFLGFRSCPPSSWPARRAHRLRLRRHDRIRLPLRNRRDDRPRAHLRHVPPLCCAVGGPRFRVRTWVSAQALVVVFFGRGELTCDTPRQLELLLYQRHFGSC